MFYGNFVCFENVLFIYVVLIGLFIEELDIWMIGNNCVFLVFEFRLDCLFWEFLGVGDIMYMDCYINFIFLKFLDFK